MGVHGNSANHLTEPLRTNKGATLGLMMGAADGIEQVSRTAALPRPWGRRLRWLAAAVLTAAAAVVILRTADGALLRDGIEEIARRPGLLALFIGGYAAAFALRAFAWRALLGRAGEGVGSGRLIAILHASLFANHLAAGEGRRAAATLPRRPCRHPDRGCDRLDGGGAAARCRSPARDRRGAVAADRGRRGRRGAGGSRARCSRSSPARCSGSAGQAAPGHAWRG